MSAAGALEPGRCQSAKVKFIKTAALLPLKFKQTAFMKASLATSLKKGTSL